MQGLGEEYASVGKPIHFYLWKMRISSPSEDGVADSGTLFSRVGWTILTGTKLFTEVICPFVQSICYISEIFLSDLLYVLKISFFASICDPTKGPILGLLSPSTLISGAESRA